MVSVRRGMMSVMEHASDPYAFPWLTSAASAAGLDGARLWYDKVRGVDVIKGILGTQSVDVGGNHLAALLNAASMLHAPPAVTCDPLDIMYVAQVTR